MKRSPRQVADLLHKGVVCACMGLTLYGCSLAGLRFYNYFAVIRPTQAAIKQTADKKLLQDADELSDLATTVKS